MTADSVFKSYNILSTEFICVIKENIFQQAQCTIEPTKPTEATALRKMDCKR